MRVSLVYDKQQQTYKYVTDEGVTIGVGTFPQTATEDAERNIQREPLAEIQQRGSPTWSLKSDEAFWKGRKDEKAIR